MRTTNIGGTIALALSLGACDAPPTAPEMRGPSASLSHGAPPTKTTFLLRITGFRPISQIVLPSGARIQENEFTFVSTRDWVGTLVTRARQVVHTNGLITSQATSAFEGTVLSLEGTVEISLASVFDFSSGSLVVTAGRTAILRGTGELANIRGQGSFQAVGPGIFEGDFHVQFAP